MEYKVKKRIYVDKLCETPSGSGGCIWPAWHRGPEWRTPMTGRVGKGGLQTSLDEEEGTALGAQATLR